MYAMGSKLNSGEMIGKLKSVNRCECGGILSVTDSRRIKSHTEKKEVPLITRRRRCDCCGNRFSTYEISEHDIERILFQIETLNNLREILK